MQQNFKELSGWIVRDSGSIQAKADFELSLCVTCLHEAAALPSQAQGIVLPSAAGRLSFARRQALGVVGVISPFNFPLYLALRAVAPALALGNAVVLKPDPRTAVSGGFLIARVFEEAGLPEDLLHVLPGGADAGAALCADPDVAMIQFTGSTAAGRKVGALAGGNLKKLSLELGGKSSLIVLDDVDLDLAASNIAWAAYLHQGQICMTAGRILVHEAIASEIVNRVAAKAKGLPSGDPMTGQVAQGPMINEHQAMAVERIVSESIAAGAKLEAGGTRAGSFFKPTVLSGVKPGMRAFEEEMFGPVAAITTFASEAEAIALANQTEYGLSAAVLSGSVSRALAIGNRLNTGILHINDQTVGDDVVNPFGGVGSSGNGTSIGGPANWEEFTQWRWVTLQETPPAYPF
jgi:benzaldehyde dehydrogenase (NAD)